MLVHTELSCALVQCIALLYAVLHYLRTAVQVLMWQCTEERTGECIFAESRWYDD